MKIPESLTEKLNTGWEVLNLLFTGESSPEQIYIAADDLIKHINTIKWWAFLTQQQMQDEDESCGQRQ